MRCVFGHDVEGAHEGRYDPTIAPRPITIFAIWRFIRGHKILITPPKTVFGVKKPLATMFVFGEIIEVEHFLKIAIVFVLHTQTSKNRHGHLEGINPPPIIFFIAVDHVIHRCFYGGNAFSFGRIHQKKVEIDLPTGLVVAVAGGCAVAQIPFVFFAPFEGIIQIFLFWINFIKSHQAFVIDGTSPNIGRSGFVGGPNRFEWVGPLFHEISIGEAHFCHNCLLFGHFLSK